MFTVSRIGGLAGGAGSAVDGGGGGASLIIDTFTENSVDVNLENHVPDVGTSWTKRTDTTGGRFILVFQALDVAHSFLNALGDQSTYTAQPGPTSVDYDVICDIQNQDLTIDTDDPCWLIGRWTDVSNYYAVGIYPLGANPDLVLIKRVSDVVTLLDSANLGIDFTIKRTVKFEIRDAAKKLFVDGIERLSDTDNSLTGAGEAGLGLGDLRVTSDDSAQDWHFDDFEVQEM